MESVIGLDIGSHSIKLLELVNGPSPTLVAAGSVPTPFKALTSQNAADTEAVGAAIKKLVKDTGCKTNKVNIALPEYQVFTRIIDVPQLSQKELASAIKWEAEQYIPLPLDQVTVDFTVLRDSKELGENKMEVLLVACPKTLLEKYLLYVDYADLTVEAVETEIIASSRALVRAAPNAKNVMSVSLGAQTTDIAILRGGVLAFTRSMGAGGDALSRALSERLGFEISQAEAYKKTYGLEQDKVQGKIVEAVRPIMDTIVSEIKRAIAYYQERFRGEQIDVLVLGGGTAKLPGIVVYIAQAINVEVQLANPWVGIKKDSRFAVIEGDGPVFATALGLALR